jgi:hypothetical protein
VAARGFRKAIGFEHGFDQADRDPAVGFRGNGLIPA